MLTEGRCPIRLIFSGDWQCSVTNLPQCELLVDQICRVLRKSPVEDVYFVHTGDAKETTNPVDQRVTNFLIEAFEAIRTYCSGIAFVRGNHDNINTQDNVASCAPVIQTAGANWIADTGCTIMDLDGTVLFLVPYFRDPERQKASFLDASHCAERFQSKHKILVFHNEIDGCDLSHYVKGSGLTRADICADAYDLCVGGHVHKAQFLPPNIHYVGSPFAQDWGEANYKHRILVADIHDQVHANNRSHQPSDSTRSKRR